MKIKSLLLAAVGIFAFQFAFADEGHIKTLDVNGAAPEFSLKGHDGKTYSLKDYKGKIVVLEWFNEDCPYVKKHYETNNMQTLQEKYIKEGVIWFSIHSTKPTKALSEKDAKEDYDDEKSKATALLLDSNGDVARSYGAKTTPHMFVIGKDGKVAYMGAIDDKNSFKEDTVKGAKNYVAEALDVLLGKSKKKTIETTNTKPYGCSVKI